MLNCFVSYIGSKQYANRRRQCCWNNRSKLSSVKTQVSCHKVIIRAFSAYFLVFILPSFTGKINLIIDKGSFMRILQLSDTCYLIIYFCYLFRDLLSWAWSYANIIWCQAWCLSLGDCLFLLPYYSDDLAWVSHAPFFFFFITFTISSATCPRHPLW